MRLALSTNRLDWWNVVNELGETRLRQWFAYDKVEGVGSRRDDMRAAYFTDLVLRSQGAELEDDSFVSLAQFVDRFTDDLEPEESELNSIQRIAMACGIPLSEVPDGR